MIHENRKKKAAIIQKIVADNYEPGRQDRCKLWIYRNIISKTYPMSQVTFFRLLAIKEPPKPKEEDKRQLKLFEDF